VKDPSIPEKESAVFVSINPDVRQTLQRMLKHTATWVFVAAWLSALVMLILTGHSETLALRIGITAAVLLLALGTVILTTGRQVPMFVQRSTTPIRLWIQLAVIILIILFTAVFLYLFRPLIKNVPNDLINPFLYFVLPLMCLLPLGVRLRELHLGPGWHSWRVMLLWIIPLLLLFLFAEIRGPKSGPIWAIVIGNIFQNGFFEEFLWRGALMSRLRLLMDDGWAIVLSSLFFGLWHTQAVAADSGGNFLAAMAATISTQAVIGLGFAVIVHRTRNLLASSIVHVIWDSAFQVLG
jgi:membrane protease YdiL (CAAX protease family)